MKHFFGLGAQFSVSRTLLPVISGRFSMRSSLKSGLFLLGLALFLHTPAFAKKKITLACFDCYSSASLYPLVAQRLIAQYGLDVEIEWILVQTHKYKSGQEAYLSAFPEKSRREMLTYDGEALGWEIQAEKDLRQLGVGSALNSSLLGGMDEGSYQLPLVAQRFGFKHNPVATRDDRKKKDRQMALAKELGMGIPTERFDSVEQALRFIATFPQDEFVVKFNDGVSGVGMDFYSKSDPDLRKKLEAKLASPKTGPFNKEDFFIIQPRIQGRKFFINTFTFEGETVVTGLSEYFMIDWNGTTLYFIDPFLSLTSAEAKALGPLALAINARMQVTHGAAHLEFILDSLTGQYYLLENNVRMAGAGVPALETEVYGIGQLEHQLLSALAPEVLRAEMAKYPRASQNGGLIVVIPSAQKGTLSAKGVAALESLETYFRPSEQYRLKAGTPVTITQDQNTALALLHLRGDPAKIRSDVEKIAKWVQEGTLVDEDPQHPSCPAQMLGLGNLLNQSIEGSNWHFFSAL